MTRSLRLVLPISLCLAAAALLIVTLSARGASDPGVGTEPGAGAAPDYASELAAESAACAERGQATNFEAFSAGPAPLGLPLSATLRRCDVTTDKAEPGANYVSYIYGDCDYRSPELPDGGCTPPLEIQTWPACDRSLADYTYEGKPYPYEALPQQRGAEVAGFDGGTRLELYSGSSTVVVFANDPKVAQEVLALLRPQGPATAPAVQAAELGTELPQTLAPPVAGAVEGTLSCGS